MTMRAVRGLVVQLSRYLDVGLILSNEKDFNVFVFQSDYICGILKMFHMSLSNVSLVAFHYRSYGTFFLHTKSPIIAEGEFPTTAIIEPLNDKSPTTVDKESEILVR